MGDSARCVFLETQDSFWLISADEVAARRGLLFCWTENDVCLQGRRREDSRKGLLGFIFWYSPPRLGNTLVCVAVHIRRGGGGQTIPQESADVLSTQRWRKESDLHATERNERMVENARFLTVPFRCHDRSLSPPRRVHRPCDNPKNIRVCAKVRFFAQGEARR